MNKKSTRAVRRLPNLENLLKARGKTAGRFLIKKRVPRMRNPLRIFKRLLTVDADKFSRRVEFELEPVDQLHFPAV